ncbi:hypothetical protein A0H81_12072 [Grifola frondosa]|uniref:DUF6699 domain-containing protein n=1 Tax=Grifola frondosa TaxID=5627 RepID=A0A1C7LTY7_GRIFR|nr:hypothetical protein A0H81_12072 [Grifola frondosa]
MLSRRWQFSTSQASGVHAQAQQFKVLSSYPRCRHKARLGCPCGPYTEQPPVASRSLLPYSCTPQPQVQGAALVSGSAVFLQSPHSLHAHHTTEMAYLRRNQRNRANYTERYVNIDEPWYSPRLELFPIPPLSGPPPVIVQIAVLKFPKKLRFKREEEDDSEVEEAYHWSTLPREKHVVKPEEWRAYGRWARPTFKSDCRTITVSNATPPKVHRELTQRQVEAMMRDMQFYDDARRWVPRSEHPALPPRPPLWPTPPPSPRPKYRPSELQLNPFLKHRHAGPPPMICDLRESDIMITLGSHPAESADTYDPQGSSMMFGPDSSNGMQPATYPGVTEMRISALADDTHRHFPWPLVVVPHHPSLPVMVKDVVNAIIANFEEFMTIEEVCALDPVRRVHIYEAYYRRVRHMLNGKILGDSDGLRRIDYLINTTFFRGIEPAPDGHGFIMFLGSS